MTRHTVVVSILLFPIVLTAPFADELIGQWQFSRLCEREAVVTLSPDWEKVKRARDKKKPIVVLDGYAIPIRSQNDEYLDIDTGRTFVSYQRFHTNGGFLRRNLLGLEGSTTCRPKPLESAYTEIHLQTLLDNGK